MSPGFLRAVLLALVVAVTTPGAVVAAPSGQPLLQRYGPDDYGANPANFEIVTLADGSLAIGNGRGLLTYDGSHWNLFELPGRSPARALLMGRDERLYVGGYDQFGWVEFDPTGALKYVDLRPDFQVDGARADFGDVWQALGTRDGVLFRTDSRLFFAGYRGERQTWPLDVDLRRMFVIGEQVYARVHGMGLVRFENGGFQLEPGGEQFAERALATMFARGDGRLLVSDTGFFQADAKGIRAIVPEASAVLRKHSPNAGRRLSDGSLVFGTDQGELLHFSAELELLGLHEVASYSVLELGSDREGGLWVATEGGLSRLRLPSPWSAFSAADGLSGSVRDTAFHDGELWVGTSIGAYRARQVDGRTRFELVVDTSLEASALLEDPHGLLVGDRDGVLWHREGQPDSRIVESNSTYLLQRSRFHPEVVFAVSDGEILRLRFERGAWQILSRWPLLGMSVGTVDEVAADRVWLDNYRGGPQRWDYDPASGEVLQRREFGSEQGLQIDLAFGSVLHRLDDALYAVSGRRVFRLQGEYWVEYLGEPFNRTDFAYEMAVVETEFGDFAFTPYQLLRRLPGTQDWQQMHLGAGLTRGFIWMQTDADGVLRVITWGGLLQYDPGIAEHPVAPLKVGLDGFLLRDASGSTRRLPLRNPGALQLESGESLVFDYHMVTMDPGVEFRFRIDGIAGGWSDWSAPSRPALTLRNPGPGRYQLLVEGRTRLGRVAEPLRFEFEISPAWWQTTQARVAGVFGAMLLLLLIAHLFVRIRYRQYLADNRRLERKIAERTAELEQANRKLAELATEDSLTGVANRRALEQGLNREWERCAELGQPLAVIMVDVDHFKQFNDRYGHLEGDQQLVRVARELSGRVRPVRELLARFGGEEFAIVLPGATLDEAVARAEVMRAAFDQDGSATTVSVGVSSEIPSPGRTPIDLLRAADEALYAAKRAGRNRVMRAAA